MIDRDFLGLLVEKSRLANHDAFYPDDLIESDLTSHGEAVMTKGFIHPFGGSQDFNKPFHALRALEKECDGNLKCLRSG